MADEDRLFREFAEEGGEIPRQPPGAAQSPVMAEAPAKAAEGGVNLLGGILDTLLTISGAGLPVKGAIVTKAIGSKL